MREQFEEVEAAEAGKRLGVNWAPWMGDWFVSHSPRNGNSNAEGEWDQWVDLACKILRDPLTAITRPDAHAVAVGAEALEPKDYYTGADVTLTKEQLAKRFPDD